MRFTFRIIYLFFILAGLMTCSPKKPGLCKRSFYYWKTTFNLSEQEKQILENMQVQKLYLRFFDVKLDNSASQPMPEGILSFNQKPVFQEIVPVVFITNRTLLNISENETTILSEKIVRQIEKIADRNSITFKEVQIDCDWSENSRDNYFKLLENIRSKFTRPVFISVTIRLHQVKYKHITGVPPADQGMLMFYNMGKLSTDATEKSIFNKKDAEKYLTYINDYPMKLDIALPVFSWDIQIRGKKIIDLLAKSLIKPEDSTEWFEKVDENHFIAVKSFYRKGIYFRKGDLLKREQLSKEELSEAAEMLSHTIKKETRTVALFDLDQYNLSHYNNEDLEEIFNHFN